VISDVEPGRDLRFQTVDATSAGARAAIRRYVEELTDRLPHGFTAEEALAGAALAYNPPHGLYVIATPDDETLGALNEPAEPLAGGAITFLDGDRAELKRMWVSPASRGAGLAAALLEHLEGLARAHGRTMMVLDTNSGLGPAVRLYERHGYARIPAYNENVDADVWFAKALR
jgi:GNAT superfamily N-acetyltransferase